MQLLTCEEREIISASALTTTGGILPICANTGDGFFNLELAKAVELFKNHSANFNLQNATGDSPFILQAKNIASPKISYLMLSGGADKDQPDAVIF